MMFERIDKIDNVLRYFLNEKQLIYSSESENDGSAIRKTDLSTSNLLANKETDSTLFTFVGIVNGFFAKDISGNGLLIDNSLDILFKIPSPLKIGENHLITDFLSVYQGRIKNREFGIYSIPMNKVLWMDSQQKALETFGDKVLGQSDFELHRTNPSTGEIFWKSDLKIKFPELTGIKGRIRLLGLCGNLVIATIENIDRLIALDLETGELKWDRKSFPSLDRLDQEKGIVHSISSGYCKLDAITGKEVDTFIDHSYFKAAGIFSQRNNYAIDGDHLITTDYQKGVIGAFNTATHKFDWLHEEEGVSFPAPSPIIYQAPYLLVHDNKRTLHIFEKE